MSVSRATISAALALAVALPCAAQCQTVAGRVSTGGNVVDDQGSHVKIGWEDRGAEIVFTAIMPQGYLLTVGIDRDRNGKWGVSAYDPKQPSMIFSADVQVAGNADRLCGQHIYTWNPEHPEAVKTSSACSSTLFGGHAEVSQPDAQGMVTTRYFLASSDVFQGQVDAHLAFRVWDGHDGSYLYYSPVSPLIATRAHAP